MPTENQQIGLETTQTKSTGFFSVKGLWWKLALMIMAVAVIAGAGFYSRYTQALQPVKPGSAQASVVQIPAGSSTTKVAGILSTAGLIKDPKIFVGYARYHQLENRIKAGEYQLSPAMSTPDILRKLTQGQVVTYSFTIPEGYTTQQIADLLARKGYVNRQVFMDEIAQGQFNYDFVKGLPSGNERLEGYLFPDTYKIGKGMSEKAIINMMLKRFAKEVTPEYLAKIKAQGLTLYQAVTLASIVEREAAKDSERPKVAAVFLNRLKIKMPLESCATVQFALGEHKYRLLYKDLKVKSPYNTYLHAGLPVGPIASPGRASLQAVANPAPVDYLYFVVSKDGQHAFSKTLAEHNRNKAKYVARFNIQN